MNFNNQNNINKKISDRNIPSNMLQPYLDIRPISTKYTYFQIIDSENNNKINQLPTYNIANTFNPGNTKSPWSGFNSNIESELRNQTFKLQKCDQRINMPIISNKQPQIPTLNKSNNTIELNPKLNHITNNNSIFNNSTRNQIKDI